MTTPADEFTELVDADIARVDLVDKAANGLPFLIAKQVEGVTGLMDPGFIRDLIAKSEPETEPAAAGEQVTMTGSPTAIAKLIHGAPIRSATPESPADRILVQGRSISERVVAGVLPHADAVAKDAPLDDSADDMDPNVPLAAPEEDAPGDPAEPGSPAWEAVDAATARKWTSVLARAKHAVSMLADREMTEGVTVDPGDIDNAINLEDACCAIDYAISVLAPFAVAEQAEADCAAEQMAAVGKALGDWDTAPLDTIEALAHVAKAGRVLSTGNEAAIRGAVEQLQKVLASLPAAPETAEDGDRPVVKQEDTVADATTQAADPVEKAEQVPQVPIYDRRGNLVGIVDPASIIPIAIDEDDEPESAPVDDVTDVTDAAEVPAPETADLTPEPAAEAGIPADTVTDDGDDIAKTTDDTNPDDTTTSDAESSNTDVTKSPDEHSATQEQAIAKQAETIAQLAESVATLKAQLRTLEEQPAEPKVFTNGAVPPPHQMRGQDRGAPTADVTKARELKKSLYQGPDAAGQNAIHTQLNEMAIAELQNIHNGGARP